MAGIPDLNDCQPGVRAIGFNAIIAVEKTPDKVGSIYIPDSERDKKDVTAMRGRLVSLGEAAFDYAKFDAPPAKQGDAVLFAHLAGKRIEGRDDKHYRVMTDRDIIGVLEGE